MQNCLHLSAIKSAHKKTILRGSSHKNQKYVIFLLAVALYIHRDCFVASCQDFRNIGRRERVARSQKQWNYKTLGLLCSPKNTFEKLSSNIYFQKSWPGSLKTTHRSTANQGSWRKGRNTVHASTRCKNDNIWRSWYKCASSVKILIRALLGAGGGGGNPVCLLQKRYRGYQSFSMAEGQTSFSGVFMCIKAELSKTWQLAPKQSRWINRTTCIFVLWVNCAF